MSPLGVNQLIIYLLRVWKESQHESNTPSTSPSVLLPLLKTLIYISQSSTLLLVICVCFYIVHRIIQYSFRFKTESHGHFLCLFYRYICLYCFVYSIFNIYVTFGVTVLCCGCVFICLSDTSISFEKFHRYFLWMMKKIQSWYFNIKF